MKIVIDLQSTQAENRFQGIGRYSLSLAKAIAANAGEHDVYIVLSKSLPGTIEDIRAAFQHVLPQERIVAFSVPDGTAALRCTSPFRARAAELLREQFLAGLKPDVVLLISLFEGLGNDSVTSVGLLPHTYLSAVVLHDLIPLAMPQDYLQDGIRNKWYREKLEHLKRADLALAVSEFTKEEASRLLGMRSDRMAVIGAAADGVFKRLDLAEHEQIRIRERMGISKPFVLSVVSENDRRKNIVGLFRAFAMLPQDIKHRFQLVVSGSATKAEKDAILHQAREAGLSDGDVVLTGYVTDDDLAALYNLCSLSVFPSLYEGFGLPVIEAMACGAPAICSSTTSLPEVMSCDEALFDPASPSAIAAKMTEVLTDDAFADRLVGNGRRQVSRFSWDRSAKLTLAAFEDALGRKNTSLRYADGITATGTATVTDAVTDASTDAGTSTAKYVGAEPATATDVVTDAATDMGMGPVGGTEVHRASAHNASKPALAFISPFPPDQTGIAGYSAELVPALAEYYDIEVITAHGASSITGGGAHGITVRTPQWFERNADRYDRVLYQMGNSPFHVYQLDLLERHPGVVVLHDFVLEGLYRGLEGTGSHPHVRQWAAYHAHRYEAIGGVGNHVGSTPAGLLMNRYVCERAIGMIVHSRYARDLASQYYGNGAETDFVVVPQLRGVQTSPKLRSPDGTALRRRLGIGEDDLLVCSFGIVGPIKLSHQLLEAFTSLDVALQDKLHLVFVGGRYDDPYTIALDEEIEKASSAGWDVRCTDWVGVEEYDEYLRSADVAVQLRTDSRGETSRALLDCLAHGIPTIISDHGPASELPGNVVVKLPDDSSSSEISRALSALLASSERRSAIGRDAAAYVSMVHAPALAAALYREAIESMYANDLGRNDGYVVSRLAKVARQVHPSDNDLLETCLCMARNGRRYTKRQLLLDISQIVVHDLRTGIERVSRAVLHESFHCSQLSSFRVEPVYSMKSKDSSLPYASSKSTGTAARTCYGYARKYTSRFLGVEDSWAVDGPITFSSGDVFFGLDWAADKVPGMANVLADMRDSGVIVFFFVYDILPILHPEWFPPEMEGIGTPWLQVVSAVSDGLICNSRATARAVFEWMDTADISRQRPLRIGYCHLGADLEPSIPTVGLPSSIEAIFPALAKSTTFLMVGTLEPRKGHEHVLDAFEMLWEEGYEADLIIAGKAGWMVDDVINRIRSHGELGKHLFWFNDVSDEALERLYRSASCLVAASFDEGFGLPLIEAARMGLPVIARDIPVFREIAGDGALYFDGLSPSELVSAVKRWLGLHEAGEAPSPNDISYSSWADVASTIAEMFADESHANWLYEWKK